MSYQSLSDSLKVHRAMYRCQDCLGVISIDQGTPTATWKCPYCGGPPKFLGYVQRSQLVKVDSYCPCDDRCTHAMGPNCDCKCGGTNHGIGTLWHIEVVSGVSRLQTSERKALGNVGKLQEVGMNWRALCSLCDEMWMAKYGEVGQKLRAGKANQDDRRFYWEGKRIWIDILKIKKGQTMARVEKMESMLDSLSV